MYGGYGIKFDGKGKCGFGDNPTKNFIIFGVDNSFSCHADNHKSDFLILGKDPTFCVNASFRASEKNWYWF